MKRGEIWTASGPNYTGKPRPVVIVQSDSFSGGDSITVCPFTTDPQEASMVRFTVSPGKSTGLREVSRIMADKITTVPRSKLGRRIGELPSIDLLQLERALLVFLGLAA